MIIGSAGSGVNHVVKRLGDVKTRQHEASSDRTFCLNKGWDLIRQYKWGWPVYGCENAKNTEASVADVRNKRYKPVCTNVTPATLYKTIGLRVTTEDAVEIFIFYLFIINLTVYETCGDLRQALLTDAVDTRKPC